MSFSKLVRNSNGTGILHFRPSVSAFLFSSSKNGCIQRLFTFASTACTPRRSLSSFEPYITEDYLNDDDIKKPSSSRNQRSFIKDDTKRRPLRSRDRLEDHENPRRPIRIHEHLKEDDVRKSNRKQNHLQDDNSTIVATQKSSTLVTNFRPDQPPGKGSKPKKHWRDKAKEKDEKMKFTVLPDFETRKVKMELNNLYNKFTSYNDNEFVRHYKKDDKIRAEGKVRLEFDKRRTFVKIWYYQFRMGAIATVKDYNNFLNRLIHNIYLDESVIFFFQGCLKEFTNVEPDGRSHALILKYFINKGDLEKAQETFPKIQPVDARSITLMMSKLWKQDPHKALDFMQDLKDKAESGKISIEDGKNTLQENAYINNCMLLTYLTIKDFTHFKEHVVGMKRLQSQKDSRLLDLFEELFTLAAKISSSTSSTLSTSSSTSLTPSSLSSMTPSSSLPTTTITTPPSDEALDYKLNLQKEYLIYEPFANLKRKSPSSYKKRIMDDPKLFKLFIAVKNRFIKRSLENILLTFDQERLLEKANVDKSDIEDLQRCLKECKVQSRPVMNGGTFDLMIQAYHKLGMMKNIVELFKKYDTSGFKPKEISVNMVMMAHASMKDSKAVIQRIEEMKPKYGISPTIRSYTVCMSALLTNDRWREALKIYDIADADNNVQLDIKLYSQAISACKLGGKHNIAFAIHRRIKQEKLSEPMEMQRDLLAMAKAEGKVQLQRQLMTERKARRTLLSPRKTV